MNPHFHPYSELSSPHPPSPDNNNYHQHPSQHPHAHQHQSQHSIQHNMSHPGGQITNGHNSHLGPGNPQGHDHHFGNVNVNVPSMPHHQMHNNNNNNTIKHCAGCGGKIVERFLLHALDRYWHNGCLKCSCCGAMLADIGSSCFTRGGMILCKTDYTRMFGGSGACSACGQSIPASEFVMRTGPASGGTGANNGAPVGAAGAPQHHVFHLKCFACSKCGAHLVPGDRYYMLAGSLVCEQDWHKLIKSSTGTAAGTTTVRKGKVGRPRRSRD